MLASFFSRDDKGNKAIAYLEIAEVGGSSIQEADRRKLNGGVQTHILEAAEAGNQSGTALPKTITSATRPGPRARNHGAITHLITSGQHEMSNLRLVNGAATDASASEREIPTSAALRAPQSFAPSPQKPTQ